MLASMKIGKKGMLKNGKKAGFFIRIDDDSQNTGGYLILIWEDNSREGCDYWVEKRADIDQFMSEAGREIEWLE